MKNYTILTFLLLLKLNVYAQVDLNDSVTTDMLAQARQYISGVGRPRDEKRALDLYQKCATAGNAKAMNALGIIYNEGIGVASDHSKAVEWFTKSANTGYAGGWYNLGMHYKDGKDSSLNFQRAFECFDKAAQMGDEQSIYAKAYFLYKGLGCQQDYLTAAILFERGARLGRSNSMYFLGLCYRNGYGVEKNDSVAKSWLIQATRRGDRMAKAELDTSKAENSNELAQALAERLKIRYANQTEGSLNHYHKIDNNIPANAIEGTYGGYVIQYDWSGKHAINSARLLLEIHYRDRELIGRWIENDTLIIPFEAFLTRDALIFKNTEFKKTDHYSPEKPISYFFQNATLRWLRKNNMVYLAGNMQMFSPVRNEPGKPMFISLDRVATFKDNLATITLLNRNGIDSIETKPFSVYPNPFTNFVNVEFSLKEATSVETRLLTLDGRVLYRNDAGLLTAGQYILPLKAEQQLTPGIYLVELRRGINIQTVKTIKQ